MTRPPANENIDVDLPRMTGSFAMAEPAGICLGYFEYRSVGFDSFVIATGQVHKNGTHDVIVGMYGLHSREACRKRATPPTSRRPHA